MSNNDSEQYRGSAFDQEDTIILKDSDGCYYAIPAKHMSLNAVKPAFYGNMEEALGRPRQDASIAVVGVFSVSKTLRRSWTTPIIQEQTSAPNSPTS